jgi:predicted DNA-binding WGR domain protein
MTEPVTLHRVDPSRNMARFYRLVLQPDLFGGCSLVREWGRIGSAGQVRATAFPTAEAAEVAQMRLLQAKERRGYQRTSATVH